MRYLPHRFNPNKKGCPAWSLKADLTSRMDVRLRRREMAVCSRSFAFEYMIACEQKYEDPMYALMCMRRCVCPCVCVHVPLCLHAQSGFNRRASCICVCACVVVFLTGPCAYNWLAPE